MKIRCEVCEKEEASVYCCADEAALCKACDQLVHHANKLAAKHLRFTIPNPGLSASQILCDICQERRAILFCQEDRAILCRECDFPIHQTNQHTHTHTRFLLTGVKLSPETSVPSHPVLKTRRTQQHTSNFDIFSSASAQQSTSSLSEYLMETLPGWGVEELLDHHHCNPPSAVDDENFRVCGISEYSDDHSVWEQKPYSCAGMNHGFF